LIENRGAILANSQATHDILRQRVDPKTAPLSHLTAGQKGRASGKRRGHWHHIHQCNGLTLDDLKSARTAVKPKCWVQWTVIVKIGPWREGIRVMTVASHVSIAGSRAMAAVAANKVVALNYAVEMS
jgi:hypothetical protein